MDIKKGNLPEKYYENRKRIDKLEKDEGLVSLQKYLRESRTGLTNNI